MENKEIRIWFDHGCGDVCHFSRVLQLYKNRGYDVKIHYEMNKKAIWDAAGIVFDKNPGIYHEFQYHGGFNSPTPEADYSGNKIASNLIAPLPDIGKIEDLWEEICNVEIKHIPPQSAVDEALKFIDRLPRPIILLHTNGSNWTFEKDLPHGNTMELYRLLLDNTKGSIILLDWDFRVPMLDHGRIRHLKRDWGHIDLMQFSALYNVSDLLIGVDSGPLHWALFHDIPVLGVFHHFYPSCVCLPRAKTVHMTRDADSYKPVNFARRPRWNIVEYNGEYPPAKDILHHALRLLSGPKFLSKELIGRDVMMQQWLDWSHGSTGLSGHTDRGNTFSFILEAAKKFTNPVFVETGCIRSHEDWGGAGNSTYLFACYVASRNGKLFSVDINQDNATFAAKEISQWKANAAVACKNSIDFLTQFQDKIDVLYLDSLDCEEPNHPEHALIEIKNSEKNMHDQSLIAIDDTVWNGQWHGKGALAVPYLLDKGWNIVSCGYQTVLSKSTV